MLSEFRSNNRGDKGAHSRHHCFMVWTQLQEALGGPGTSLQPSHPMGRGSEALEPGSSTPQPHPLSWCFRAKPELINQAGGAWNFRHVI